MREPRIVLTTDSSYNNLVELRTEKLAYLHKTDIVSCITMEVELSQMGQRLINSFVLMCAECTTDMETIVKAMMQETKDIFD